MRVDQPIVEPVGSKTTTERLAERVRLAIHTLGDTHVLSGVASMRGAVQSLAASAAVLMLIHGGSRSADAQAPDSTAVLAEARAQGVTG